MKWGGKGFFPKRRECSSGVGSEEEGKREGIFSKRKNGNGEKGEERRGVERSGLSDRRINRRTHEARGRTESGLGKMRRSKRSSRRDGKTQLTESFAGKKASPALRGGSKIGNGGGKTRKVSRRGAQDGKFWQARGARWEGRRDY